MSQKEELIRLLPEFENKLIFPYFFYPQNHFLAADNG